jgi:hypothetical protein
MASFPPSSSVWSACAEGLLWLQLVKQAVLGVLTGFASKPKTAIDQGCFLFPQTRNKLYHPQLICTSQFGESSHSLKTVLIHKGKSSRSSGDGIVS